MGAQNAKDARYAVSWYVLGTRDFLRARSPEAIQFMEERQENSHHKSDPLGVLICVHSCDHRAASLQLFHDGVSRPRHKYAANKTSQVTNRPQKCIFH